ncbi:hypothetical protein [Ancylomarina longa]|uniref:Lipocalin-like domain-containing protein n=1 Tax=Ancylomarina longa TaxID=2487017 RepID=A0A434B063_9BACT|nr:hypothetical protein [Ancylomarina longa]RUT80174.1 hypothetical protein DLK05_02150 [Ancylomarina longa]
MKTNNCRNFGIKGLLLSGIILLTFACTDNRTVILDPVTTAINSLVGEWNWIKTVDAWTAHESNPETEGYTASIQFRTNDTLEYYKNGNLIHKYPYELRYRINDPLNTESDSILVLVINNGAESNFSIAHDALIISQAYLDGPTSYYERKK